MTMEAFRQDAFREPPARSEHALAFVEGTVIALGVASVTLALLLPKVLRRAGAGRG